MANRYWVGGTGNWLDDTNHWSASSGGSGGLGNLPTATDDVIIDANSGFGSGGTITLDSDLAVCHNFTATSGHSYTIAYGNSDLYIYGSAVFESGIDVVSTTTYLYFFAEDTGNTIRTNGFIGYNYLFGSSDGTSESASWILQDNLTTNSAGSLTFSNGTFDANDKKIITGQMVFDNSTATANPTVTMGTNTWEISASTIIYVAGGDGVITINPETSTIKSVYSDAGDLTVISNNSKGVNGLTFNDLWIVAPNTPQIFFGGSVTWGDVTIDCVPNSIFFVEDTTTTVTGFTANGTEGNLIALNSYVVGGGSPTLKHNLSQSSGTVICDYLDISNSNATGGATWYAGSHSANTTNNSGWIFTDVPTGSSVIPNKKLGRRTVQNIMSL